MLSDGKVLITGVTGQIGRPIAERLMAENEVCCAARFSVFTHVQHAAHVVASCVQRRACSTCPPPSPG